MADETTPDKKPQAINDVAEPGKSKPSSTSKPVLVTNRPLMKDPMVVEENGSEEKPVESSETLAGKGSSKTIKPLDSSPKSEQPEEAKDKTEPAETQSEPEAEKPKKAEDAEQSKSDNSKKDDSKSPSENEDVEAARKAEHDANLQKIVDAKTYYLPINAVEKRKTKRFVIAGLLLSIVLILAWIDIALDAGLIQLGGLESVTHFFST